MSGEASKDLTCYGMPVEFYTEKDGQKYLEVRLENHTGILTVIRFPIMGELTRPRIAAINDAVCALAKLATESVYLEAGPLHIDSHPSKESN